MLGLLLILTRIVKTDDRRRKRQHTSIIVTDHKVLAKTSSRYKALILGSCSGNRTEVFLKGLISIYQMSHPKYQGLSVVIN